MAKNRRDPLKFLSLGWLLVVVAAGLVWLQIDEVGPAAWDQSRHARNTLAMLDILAGIGREHSLLDFLFYYDFYPPFSYLPAVFFHLILGRGYEVACLSTLLFWLPLLFFSTVAVGRRLIGERAGWFAGIVVISFPTVIALSKDYMTDLQSASMTALVIWAMLRCNLYLSPDGKKAAWAGLLTGAAMLVKWSMGLFLMGPLLAATARGLKRNPVLFVKNAAIAFFCGLPLALGWYFPNLRQIKLGLAYSTSYAPPSGYPDPFSFDSIAWYGRSLVADHLFVPLTILLTVGLSLLALRKRRVFWWLLFCLAVIYAGLTFARNKEIRFAMALLPFLALGISGCVLSASRWVRGGCVMLVGGMALFNLGAILYRIPRLPTRIGNGMFTLFSQEVLWWARPPRREFVDPAAKVELDARSYWACANSGRSPRQAVMDMKFGDVFLSPYRVWYHADLNGGRLRPAGGPDAPMPTADGAPSPGPPSVDFLLYPPGVPVPTHERFLPLAHYGAGSTIAEDMPDAMMYVRSSALPKDGSAYPLMFVDYPLRNALCLMDIEIVSREKARGKAVEFQFDWIPGAVGRTKLGRLLGYIRRIEASGPTPFEWEWIGPTTWKEGDLRREHVALTIPPDVSPGEYELTIRVDRQSHHHTLPPTPTHLIGPSLAPGQTSVPLGWIRVR